MKIKELYSKNEVVNINTYLEKCGINDFEEYIVPKGKYLELPSIYYRIEETVDLFNHWIKSKGIIYILQDCDADGLFSASLAYMYLAHIGIDKERIVPLFHTDKSHGLTKEIMDKIETVGVDGIWIPDAGSNDVEQCRQLRQYMDILITDHHQIEPIKDIDEFPYSHSYILINNQYNNTTKINKNLCGAGVTFKVIQYNCLLNEDYWYQDLLDIVACANLGDVMSLNNYENRCFNYYGLRNIVNPLLKELCATFIDGDITPKDIVWNVIPKINAVMRSTNQDLKNDLFYAMVGNIKDYRKIVNDVKKQHTEQRNTSKKMSDELLDNLDVNPKVLIGFVENTPYTGLIAGKISGQFNKPTLILHKTNDEYIGSVRSPIPFKQLSKESGLLTLCAGHEESYGIGFKTKDLDAIKQYFETLDLNIEPTFTVIKSITTKDNIKKYIDTFKDHKDLWGNGITEPQFHMRVNINGKEIKELGNGSTIKFTKNNLDFIMFFVSKQQKEKWYIGKNKKLTIDIIGNLDYNVFRGVKKPQMIMQNIEVKEQEEKSVSDIF